MTETEWFNSWFDTRYYSLLYKERDDKEAKIFVNKLTSHFDVAKGTKVLDLGCGTGRLSRLLSDAGMKVTGTDINENVLQKAKSLSNSKIKYLVNDSRDPFPEANFGMIISFFTSFGYFESDEEHNQVIRNVREALNWGGVFVLDFLNAHLAEQELPWKGETECEGVDFKISKQIINGYFVKDIEVIDNGKEFHYQEKVRYFTMSELKKMFQSNGLQVNGCFGDYQLNAFELEKSKRLILTGTKK